MIDHCSSPNYDGRPAGHTVDMLLLHYTGMRTADEALSRLCDGEAKVSAHYMIDEDGRVISLVPEERRAWHAGVSYWAGETNVNGCSIGIELVNPGHEFGYRAFPDAQMESLIPLCQEILGRHAIPPNRVLGHADVAPSRKEDPGELFDWAALAAAGVGLWPTQAQRLEPSSEEGLVQFGYDVRGAGEMACAIAFQRHWRQSRIDGLMDEECCGLLAWLLDQID